jgi:hypothetical protein
VEIGEVEIGEDCGGWEIGGDWGRFGGDWKIGKIGKVGED